MRQIFGEIHTRIGKEIPLRKLRRVMDELRKEGVILPKGERRGRRYLLTKMEGNRADVVNRNGQ